ncbi:MAG: hypothetical protein ACI9OJ_001573 [Myxococcota bacterium]|jgi:uncharacterized protein (TIGR01777 family)
MGSFMDYSKCMTVFERRLLLPVPATELHDWHVRPGAFERLSAPWDTVRHIYADPVRNGAKRIFEVKKGGFWMRWVADHQDVVHGEQFTDIMEAGPFKSWRHTHRFEALDSDRSRLVDHIEYALPLGGLGRAVAGGAIERDIDRMFTYRHRTTLGDLSHHGRWLGAAPLRIAITGASGLIGPQLVAFLRTGGHEVFRLVRGTAEPADDEIRWSVSEGVQDMDRLNGVDAVIHLAGAPVAQRWTQKSQKRILDSRVEGTRAIVAAIAALPDRPSVLLSASAIGFYGDTGSEVVDESAEAGDGFLAEVCQAWEAEALKSEALGVRTVRARLGLVLDPRGGALQKMLPIFKSGVGGRVGSGQQLMSWVGLDDVLSMMSSLLQDNTLSGAFNITGPAPVSQAEFATTLGQVLSRPSFAPAPAAAIKMLYGEMGEQTVLGSTGVAPARFQDLDYDFRAASLEEALRHCLGK